MCHEAKGGVGRGSRAERGGYVGSVHDSPPFGWMMVGAGSAGSRFRASRVNESQLSACFW